MSDTTLQQLVTMLREAERVLLTGHRGGDGDSLGSIIAMGHALRRMGKEVVLYGPDPVPAHYRFLPGVDEIVSSLPADARFDVTMVLDTADPALLGEDFPPPERRGRLIVVDHHAVGKEFGDLRLVEKTAAATGVLVARVLRALNVPLDEAVRQPLWCAIYTDTGGFRYSSTNAEALRAAADLVDAGLNPWDVTVALFESNPEARVRLLGRVLSTLSLSASGRVACLSISEEMLGETGADETMIDGFINFGRGIEGVEVAVQVLQMGGLCRISLRSKGMVNVGELAARFGGGGHHNAAGCRIEGDPEAVQRRLLAELEAEVERVFAGRR